MLAGFLTVMILIQSIGFCARKRRPAGSTQDKSPTATSPVKDSCKRNPVEKNSQQKSGDHVFCLPEAKVTEETTNLKSLEDDPMNPLLDPRVRARLMGPPKVTEKTQCPQTTNVADTIYNVDKEKMGQNDFAKNMSKGGVVEDKANKTFNPTPLQKCYIVSKISNLSRRKQKFDEEREHSAKVMRPNTPCLQKNDAVAPANGHEINVEPSSSSACRSPSVNMDSILVSHCMTVRDSRLPNKSKVTPSYYYAGGMATMPSKPVMGSPSQRSVLPNLSSNEQLRPTSIHVG